MILVSGYGIDIGSLYIDIIFVAGDVAYLCSFLLCVQLRQLLTQVLVVFFQLLDLLFVAYQ